MRLRVTVSLVLCCLAYRIRGIAVCIELVKCPPMSEKVDLFHYCYICSVHIYPRLEKRISKPAFRTYPLIIRTLLILGLCIPAGYGVLTERVSLEQFCTPDSEPCALHSIGAR